MAAVWDPRAPTFTGLDSLVTLEDGSILDAAQRVAAMKIHSTAVETINTFATYIGRKVGSPMLQLDIWPLANLPETGSGGTAIYDPTADVAVVNAIPAVNAYQNVDDGAVLNTADGLGMNDGGSGAQSSYKFHVGSGGGLGAGAQRVSAVRMKVTASGYGSGSIIGFIQFGLDDGAGNSVYSPSVPIAPSVVSPGTEFTFEWTTGPGGSPFTEAFIVGLASGTAFGFFSWAAGQVGAKLYVTRIRIEVDYTDEHRVVQSVIATPSAEGWLTFGPFTNWAKTAQDYVAVVRRASGGTCVIPTLDSGAAHPSGHGSYIPDVSGAGVLTALNTLLTAVHPFVMGTTAPAASVDSQPYVDLRREAVYLGRTLGQEITPSSTADRAFIQLVAGAAQDALPQAPLRARVKVTASGIQQGGELTLDPTEIADAPLSLHVLDGTLAAAATLTNGTQYDVEILSITPDYAAWEVVMLDAKSPPLSASANGYGSTTNRGEIATVESDDLDIPVLVATAPASPSGLTATPVTSNGIGGIQLGWNATVLGVNSAGYIIERLTGSRWYPIATVALEGTVSWTDWECLFGVAEQYRIRSVHINGTYSIPSATAQATRSSTVGTLTSNRVPSVNRTAGLALSMAVDFDRDQTEVKRYGSRFHDVASDPTDRGLGVTTKQLIQVSGTSRGLAMFDQLRAMLNTFVPYVCLRDPWGRRVFITLIARDGTHDGPSFGSANVRLVETTDAPDVVTA